MTHESSSRTFMDGTQKTVSEQGTREVDFLGEVTNPTPVKVMVDLETWGTKPGCAIATIGAVKFDDEKIIDEFYCRVDVASCLQLGMKIDFDTIKWWLGQSEDSRQEMCKEGRALTECLFHFRKWVLGDICHLHNQITNVEMWGNGAAFDNVILKHAYDLVKGVAPWEFWNDCCYRTMKKMFPQIKMQKRKGTHHNALDDAKNQALHLIEILKFKNKYSRMAVDCNAILSDVMIARAELATAKGELERMKEKYGELPVVSEDPSQTKLDLQ